MKPKCNLTGEDGNVFNLARVVGRTLKKAGMRKEAEEFYKRLMECKSYDESLQLMMEYVDVK